MRKTLLLLLTISLGFSGTGGNELLARPGYFKADPVLSNTSAHSANSLFTANTTFAKFLKGLAVAPPTITGCDDPILKDADAGCTANVSWNVPSSPDGSLAALYPQLASNPGVQLVTNSATFNVGSDTVIYRFQNVDGFTDCRIVVNVQDVEAPTLVCGATVNDIVEAGLCYATGVAITSPSIADNCTAELELTYSFVDADGNTQSGTINPSTALSAGFKFKLGSTTITYTVTDISSNPYTGTKSASCTQNVVITDTEAPVLTAAPANYIGGNDAGICGAVKGFISPTATDNCTVLVSWTIFTESGATAGYQIGEDITVEATGSNNVDNYLFTKGVHHIVYTATDGSGNTDTDLTTVTINDTEAPTLSGCASDITYTFATSNNGGTDCVAKVDVPKTPATDNCDASLDLVWTYSLYDSNDVLIVTDAMSNPVAGTNNVDVALAKGTYYAVYEVTDTEGNTSVQCTLNIAVIDDQAPIFTSSLMADLSLTNESAGVCYNDTLLSSPNVTDNCGSVTLSWMVTFGNDTLGSGTGAIPTFEFPVGTSTLVWTATDNVGLSVQDIVLITVEDITVPTLTIGADIAATSGATDCSAVVSRNITFGDNCGIASVVENSSYGSLADVNSTTKTFSGTFPVGGPYTVTFTVTDIHGNVTTESLDVTVTDLVNPTIKNFANIIETTDPNVCTFTRSFDIADDFTPADNCGVDETQVVFDLNNDMIYDDDTITFAGASGNFTYAFEKGITNIKVTTTDNSGNIASDIFSVSVSDQQAPTVFFQDTITVNIDPTSCTAALVDLTLTSALVSDNCTGDVYLLDNATNNQTAFGDTATGYYNLGYHNVIWTVIDEDGNSSTKTTVVWVRDVTQPSDSPNDTITIQADINLCSGKVKVFAPNSLDSCGIQTVTYSINGATPVENTVVDNYAFAVGTNLVEWATTDNNNNTRLDTSIVIVEDTQAPVIGGGTYYTLSSETGCANDTTFTIPVSDNCAIASTSYELIHFTDAADVDGDTLIGSGNIINFAFPASVNANVINVTSEDIHGNISTKTISVKVNDNQAPTIECPSDVTYDADASVCGKIITVAGDNTIMGAAVSDNCGIASITASFGDPTAPYTFPVGTTTVTVTITDNSGNTKECTFNITVLDNAGPAVTGFPTDTTVSALANECSRIVFWNEPTAIDACTGNDFTVTRTHVPGMEFAIGTTAVTYVYTDGDGNTSVKTFNITVVDNQKPVINEMPDTLTVMVPSTSCSAIVVFDVKVQDNCDAQGVSINYSIANNSELAPGYYTNMVTVKDASQNQVDSSFVIHVIDNTAPVFTTLPGNLVSCNNPVVTYAIAATDNCPAGAITYTYSHPSGSTFGAGNTTVTVTAKDASNNVVSTSFTVTVINLTQASAGLDAAYCANEQVVVTGNSPASGETSAWSYNGGSGLFATPNAATSVVNINSASTYDLVYTITSGACSTTDIVSIVVNAAITNVSAGVNRTVAGNMVELTGSPLNAGQTGMWSSVNEGISFALPTSSTTTASGLAAGANTLTWTVSAAGCESVSASVVITSDFSASTAFTPNGDGENDTFEIPALAATPNATIEIFNRWGNLVFESTGAKYGKGWDGTFEGSELPVASYYYVIDLKDGSSQKKGYVSIIR